jgi:ketosteroid isomerase-like protein
MSEAKNTVLGSRGRFGYSGPMNRPTTNTPLLPLPEVVTQYFSAANQFDAAGAAECFAPDATVHDENRDYVGRDAIRAWVQETSTKYEPMCTLLRTSVQAGRVNLSVAVSGRFPGSPVTLDYVLRLRDGKISHLTIG